MKKRVAVLDVGSNSVRLMVADTGEGRVSVVCRQKITTRLMEALVDGRLTQNGLERTAGAIRALRAQALALGAEDISAFGTSAMRDAENSAGLSHLAGLPIEVMAGDMEARLAYMGAAPLGRCGIIDIGGGSTEFIVGRDGKAEKYVSVNAGAVRGNILWRGLNRETLLARARETLQERAGEFAGLGAHKWIGVGGTITTLAAMTRQVDKYSPGAIEGCPLTLGVARNWYDTLMGMPVEARRKLAGLSANRADIIHCGAALLLAAMEITRAPIVFASDHDNLEGFIRYKYL